VIDRVPPRVVKGRVDHALSRLRIIDQTPERGRRTFRVAGWD
jgi:hypothetical protein